MTREYTRRALLGATGVVITATAGCTQLVPNGGTAPYDAAALTDAAGDSLPTPPSTFPIEVPQRWVETHRQRAAKLLDRVPAQPDIPNEAVAAELAAKRESVVANLAEGPTDEEDGDAARDRLAWGRGLRSEAAGVEGAYRAATGNVDRTAAVKRSERLREALLSFRQSWVYAAGRRPAAVVFHEHLEWLVNEWAELIAHWGPFPAQPLDAPFDVGNVVASLEQAAALKADVIRLQDRYRGSRSTTPFRYRLAGAAQRLEAVTDRTHRGLEEFTGYGEGDDQPLPFERDLTGTPARVAFRELAENVRRWHTLADDWNAGPARRLVGLGRTLAGREALATLVRQIQAGDYDRPSSAAAVADRYDTARTALQRVWRTDPQPLAVRFAEPARELFGRGHRELTGINQSGEMIEAERITDATGWLIAAQHHAAAVPTAAKRAQTILRQ